MMRERRLRAAGERPSDAELDLARRREDLHHRRGKREEALWTAHARRWYPDLAVGLSYRTPHARIYGVLRRGFLDEIVVPSLAEWHQIGVDMCHAHPVTTVTLRRDIDGKPFSGPSERRRALGDAALAMTRATTQAKG
jgi:hypothetical protein